MPNPLVAAVGGGLGSAAISSNAASKAAKSQTQAAQAGIDAKELAREQMRADLRPFVDAGLSGIQGMQQYAQPGLSAMNQQMDFAGLNGVEAQRRAIAGVSSSPELMAMMQQGENAMMQNASATGGLRGGNFQGALSQFRPAMLQQALQNRYGQLGGFANMGLGINQNLAQMGQGSAAQSGASSMTSAANTGQLLGQIGAAQAGGALGRGAAFGNLLNMPLRMQGMGMNPFGQSSPSNADIERMIWG